MGKCKKRNPRTKNQKYPHRVHATSQALIARPCAGKKEGSLCFEFPENWDVVKYDTWKFVKNDVGGEHLGFNNIKEKDMCSVDFVCIDSTTLWFIEVKDFRKGDGHGGLWSNLCNKFICSMSGLFAARYAANAEEKEFAQRVYETDNMRFVLHLELPEVKDKWGDTYIDVADIQQKMEQSFSRITPNPLIASMKNMHELPWTVRQIST